MPTAGPRRIPTHSALTASKKPATAPTPKPPAAPATGSWIASGLREFKHHGAGGRLHTWDYRNRLTAITFKTSTGTVTKTVEHKYDAFDRWIKRSVDPDGPGSTAATDTFFSFEGDSINPVLEFSRIGSASPALTHRYLWGPIVDQIFADEQVTSLSSAGNTLWALSDNLGSVRDIADRNSSTGTTTVVNHRIFDGFGQMTSQSNGSFVIILGFTGKAQDESTGLINYYRRWYAAYLGEWMSEDPSGLGPDANMSRYVGNGPTNATDPSGLFTWREYWYYANPFNTDADRNVVDGVDAGLRIGTRIGQVAAVVAGVAAGGVAIAGAAGGGAAVGGTAAAGSATAVGTASAGAAAPVAATGASLATSGAGVGFTCSAGGTLALSTTVPIAAISGTEVAVNTGIIIGTGALIIEGGRIYHEYDNARSHAVNADAEADPLGGIYEFPDKTAYDKPYVGQSGDIDGRLGDHEAAGRYLPGTAVVTPVAGDKTDREIAEHQRIQELTGGQKAGKCDAVSNQRDPIGAGRRGNLGLPEPRD